MSFQPADGPSAQIALSVGTGAVVVARAGGSNLPERAVVTLQATNGKIYVYFGAEGVTPSTATVAANGLVLFKNSKETYEAGPSQNIYLLSVAGTVNVIVSERA